jgi:HSP20 family protein
MAIFRWGQQTWDPFRDLEREVDQLLASVSLSFQGLRVGRQYPPINVYELENELLLIAELAGAKPDALEVTVAEGVLNIRGRHNGPEGVADDKYRRQERPRGVWQRSLPLPDRILEDRMSAEFTNGVLKIRLPRGAATQARQIQVLDGSTEEAPAPPPPSEAM